MIAFDGKPALLVEGLRSGYGETEILRDISLRVGHEETVAVLGPNGHGKTTLLRAISGLLPIRNGRIEFEGESLVGKAPNAIVGCGVVHIPQGDLLFPEMTVLENLLMGGYRASAWARRRERLEAVFAIFPVLKERQKQLARTLSGGERRMLAIGRGLMTDAKLLMIDEPSLGLAPVLIEDLYGRIREIKDSHLSILIVEESARHLRGLADRIYVLENGEVALEGNADELLAHEDLVRSYLGM